MLIKFELKKQILSEYYNVFAEQCKFFPMLFVTEPKLTHGVLNIICSKFGILGK